MVSALPVLDVLTNESLLHHISSYQRGLPQDLVQLVRVKSVGNPQRRYRLHLPHHAIDQNDVKMLERLYRCWKEKHAYQADTYTINFDTVWRYGLRHGDMATIQWISSKPKLVGEPNDMDKDLMAAIDAIGADRYDKVVWLLTYHQPLYKTHFTVKHTCRVAYHGDLRLFQWLEANVPNLPCSTSVMDASAAGGHLDMLGYLHGYRTEGCTSRAMDLARSLDVVQFLHENRMEGCTTKAMDEAARYGRLDIVRFLHENRSEGCTVKAMGRAARNGHLDVVRFLYENREPVRKRHGSTEHLINHPSIFSYVPVMYTFGTATGDYDLAATAAARRGHLSVLQYLLGVAPELYSPGQMLLAAKFGHFAVVQYLHRNFRGQCAWEVMGLAACCGHLEIVKYLSTYCRSSRGHAIYFAVEHGHLEIVKYLVETRADVCVVHTRSRAYRADGVQAYLDSKLELSAIKSVRDCQNCVMRPYSSGRI